MSISNLDKLVPTKYGWHVRFDKQFDPTWKPFSRPKLRQAIEYVPLFMRYLRVWYKLKRAKRRAHMDFLNPVPLQQIYGAPIGGVGCGTIGRGFRGEFCRYQLVPGLYEFNTVDANTFTVCIRRRNTTTYCQVLTPYRLRKKGLRSWNCAFPRENGHYQALYPQSWTTYDLPNQNIRLLCKQLSPIIPHNYKDSSLPVASFLWYIENLNDEPVEVSLMFTWQAGSASHEFSCRDVSHESVDVTDDEISASGISIKQTLRGMKLEYCIMGKKQSDNTITTRTNFNICSTTDGRDVWLDLTDDGRLTEPQNTRSTAVHTASCVCITTTVEPNSIKTSEFVLAWHMPVINFGLGQRQYRRWYTKFFDIETLTGSTLCVYTMKNRTQWEEDIAKWQQPILDDQSLPEWYKSALFNESYFIADGGTIWLDVSEDTTLPDHVREWGRFGYLEGHEYRMINTYDVHFYASFALIQLWPQLELSIQYDFASSVAYEKRETRTYLFHGRAAHWKTLHTVPHDLGDPDEEPWLLINAYISHDTADWKDLGLKYLLQVYRDYVYTQNKQFLIDVWPTVKMVTDRVKKQDTDGDGLVDNGGFADQTYDAWTATGASAYCGNLHIAALRACVEMARMMDDTNALDEYDVWLKLAKTSYSEKLWNGTYYNYDSSLSRHHDCIMSDQLAGFWYLRLSGHKYDDFEKDRVDSVLNTIFNMNVMTFGQGKLGAVNGMTSLGQLEVVSMQSEEIWTGVTYGLSSTMIMEDLKTQAFVTSEGIYNTCYNVAGLAFQTPEALMRDGHFRSCGYMRALSIWAIQKALELSRLESNTDKCHNTLSKAISIDEKKKKMKTLRDTNNNYSNTIGNTTQQNFSSSILSTNTRQNSMLSNTSLHSNSTITDSDANTYPSLLTQNHLQQQTICRTNQDQLSSNYNTQQTTSNSKFTTQNNNSINSNSLQSPSNPFTSTFNGGDTNQLSSTIQTYLSKFGNNQVFQSDAMNSLFYLQLMNAHTMFMQQLLTNQHNTFSTDYDSIKHNQCSTLLYNQSIPISNIDLPKDIINSGKNSQILQTDSNIFVPKTRPMTQDEIAEHARLVYQRALQRNQLQQHNDLMKHFYDTLNIKQYDSSTNNIIKLVNNNDVPSVPNVGNIATNGTFDVFDTMIASPSSCLSNKEPSINAALSSLSLVSADDVKMMNNIGSILDPSAPVFIPRESRSKLHDEDNDTSCSSSDSDFNDFHYLDQFLEEFYNSDNENDSHLITQKASSSDTTNIGDESSNNNNNNNNNNKHNINSNILGQGDTIQQLTRETTNETLAQSLSTTIEKSEYQYSIYELLNRYRNPRCHLVLPEWSRLSLILPNVCSMRAHTYKIKRYFAYRRRLYENQYLNKDFHVSTTTNISIQG
ncbi:unnamed protein product [Rotaria sp. Silwood1]|nr:unnamed protein product [Rotaria sp. Silwood1]